MSDTADLVMLKQATPSAFAGSVFTYVLNVLNLGPSTAYDVSVVDSLPSGVVVADAGDCVETSAGVLQCPAAPVTSLAAGNALTYTIVVTSSSSLLPGTVLQNRAAVTSKTHDPNPVNNTDDADTSIIGRSDLAIAKYADPPVVTAGEMLTYTVVVSNQGPSDGISLRLVDNLPVETALLGDVSISRSSLISVPVTCLGAVCETSLIALGESITFTLRTMVGASVADGTTFTNTATVYSPSDPDFSNNVAHRAVSAERESLLVISKSASPDPAITGAALEYVIHVENRGPSDAAGVVVSDTLPSGFIPESVSSSQGGCTALPCTLGTLPAGAEASITIRGSVDPLQSLSLVNVAAVTATTPLTQTELASVVITTPVIAQADMKILLESTPTSVAGMTATVHAEVTNLGPSSAAGTVITVTLPTSTTFASVALPSDDWYAVTTPDGEVVVTTTLIITPGNIYLLDFVVNLDPDIQPGVSLEFVGDVTSETPDPDLTNNRALTDTSIVGGATLRIAKTGSPETVVAGEYVTYTIVITNEGPSAARFVDVKDQLPTGLSLYSITASDGGACAGTLCQFGAVAANTTRTVTIVARVGSDVTGVVTNTAAVDSVDNSAGKPVTAEVTTTVTASATLRVSKVALSDPVYAGGNALYQIVVTNEGPSDAQDVMVTDLLPEAMRYAGGDVACGGEGTLVTCDVGVLPAGSSRTLLIQTTVASDLPDNTILTNAATVSSPTASDPVSDTVDVTVRQPVNGLVDLVIDKQGPVQATAGQVLTYTLVVTNLGPATATDVQIVDALPYEVIGMATSASQGSCNNSVVCQLGELEVGMSATVVITGWVRTETLSGTQVLNRAVVNSNNSELNPGDNIGTHETMVEAFVAVTIEKSVQPAAVAPGGALSYRIVVQNHGPSLAHNVVVTDVLPVELGSPQVTSSRGACVDGVCTLGDMPPGETVTILILGSASLTATGRFTNTALLATDTALDPESVTEAEAGIAVGDNADLIMQKMAPATVSAGDIFTYVLTARNAGPSSAVNVHVEDTLPDGVEVVDAGACVLADAQRVLCPAQAIPMLDAGAEISWTLVVRAHTYLAPGTTLQNRATVSSDTLDPNPANNTATVETSVVGRADLSIYKLASALTVTAGSEVTYTIIVSNGGPADAVSVRLVDVLPVQVQLLQPVRVERSMAPDVPVSCLATSCETSIVLHGETLTFTLRAAVESGVAHQTVLTNTAVVHSASDPDASNNIAHAPVAVLRESVLTIAKYASLEPATAGMPLAYQIVVRNLGPSDAEGVLVGDLLPAGFVVGSVSSSQGECSSLPCALGSLPAGAQASVTIQGAVASTHTLPLVNLAAVTATTPLTQTDLTQVTITTTVAAVADLGLVVDSTPTAVAGLTATIAAEVTNPGPSAATGTVVTLTLPPGAAYSDVVLPDGWYAAPNPDGTVTLSTTNVLLPGESAALIVKVDLDPSIPPGSSLAFSGVVTAETEDPNLINNRDNADTNVIAQADLAIFKQGPAAITVGDTVTYAITSVNRGPSVSSVRDIKDTLPEGITLRSASLEVSGGGTTACVDAICQVMRPIAVGEVLTMTVVGVVDSGLLDGVVLTNTATVFAENITPDLNEGNNQAHHAAPVTAFARIGIDKFDLMDPVNPGAMLVYGIVVTNTGPAIARSVTVVDTLPPHVTYHSSTGVCSESSAGVVTCQLGELEVGARRTFLIVVTVNANAPSGYMLYNAATLTSTTPLVDSVLSADEPTRILPPSGPLADLEIVKSASAPVVGGGDLVTFTLTITNHGPSPVSNAEVLDLLPDGLTLVSVRSSQGFCNAGVNCLLGALDFGVDANGQPIIVGTATITLVARAAIDLADGSICTNTAYVESEKYDPQPQNNLDDADVTVVARYADVYLRKQGALLATAGEVMTYTITVGNDGPAAAENVVLSDPLPVGVRYLSATPAPTGGSATSPVWELGSLAFGDTTTILLVVQVDPQAPPALIIVNTARVESTTPDTNLVNNQATVTTQSYGAADLEVIKTASQEIVYGDDVVFYTITVNNLGPSLSDRVDVKELIPPGTDLLSLYTSQGVCVSSICQLGNIPVGEPVVITASVQVISPTFPPGTVLTNTAVAFTNTPDPNPENNEDSHSVTVGPVVNLSVLKTSAVQTVTVGTVISYSILVTNSGPSLAPLIVVTDQMPSGFVYLSSTAPHGCTEVSPRVLVCNGGPLQAHHMLRFDIHFFVSTLGNGSVRNTVDIDAPGSNIGSGDLESSLDLPTEPVPTAILLDSYELIESEDGLVITWKTISEFRTAGFRLWRAERPDRDAAILLTPEMIPATGIGNTYTYVDSTVRERVTYWYWLQELTIDGGGWEYSVLSGRFGDDVLFLPLVANHDAAQNAETAPADAAPAQAENGDFAVYLSIIGNGFDDSMLDAAPEGDAAPQASATPTPEPANAAQPIATPTPPQLTPEPTPAATAAPTVTPLALPETPAPAATPSPVATAAPLPTATPSLAETPTPSPTATPLAADTPTPTRIAPPVETTQPVLTPSVDGSVLTTPALFPVEAPPVSG